MASREEQEAEAEKLFLAIGLQDSVAKNAVKNPKFRAALVQVVREAGAEGGCPKAQGAHLYSVAGKYPQNALVHRPVLLRAILTEDIKTNAQLDGAFEYLKKIGAQPLDKAAFEEAAGIGAEVTEAQVSAAVGAVVAANEAVLREERYHTNLKKLIPRVREQPGMRWADVPALAEALDRALASLLGPKTQADLAPPPDKKKLPKEKKPAPDKAAAASKAAAAAAEEEAWRTADPYAFLPKPEANNVVHTTVTFSDGRRLPISNTAQRLTSHLAATAAFAEGPAPPGGRVVTRFPPEPNGYLHIGHAKAMFVDFGMAAQYGGVCYLRFDDTNPEAEKQEYIDHIQDIVAWLGWRPWKVTYSSDYFQDLFDLAVQLIKRGHAYVCHQTADEIKASRERREGSPWRDRPTEESLKLFEDMRRGLVEEGAATLRMRMDPKNENYNMFDLIAYRIKFTPHPHAGDKWCIYPSYDYTHCLVDALENITHSLCTLEFESRRASYYWLLEVLDTYKPLVWEYGRLNITNNVLSKRKLNQLVTNGHVDGWDDPRLLTLAGLRRRGVTPQAINLFCREMGITRNEMVIHMHKLEHHIRADLDANSRRALGVLRPLRVRITNLPADHYEEVEAQEFPGRDKGATYRVPFTQVVYMEQTDFREQDSKDFYGLAPGKSVMLRYAYPVTCTGYTKEGDTVTEIQATFFKLGPGDKPPKGVLNWVGQPAPGREPATFEARLYEPLFLSENPGDQENWLADINPDSKAVVRGAYASSALAQAQVGERFQLERLGYFCVDPDSRPGALVLNRTVTLKESATKQAAAGKAPPAAK